MHSARMVLATAAASAVLALGAPGAYAAGDDWDHTDSSYSKEHDKEHSKDNGKEYGKDGGKEYGKEYGKDGGHDSPHGGMHTGGGALTSVNEEDGSTAPNPKFDPETYKDKDSEQGKDSGSGKSDENSWSGKKQDENSWSGKDEDSWSGHEKPSGGIHTGGGGLASPSVTAGGLAVLAVAATGLYAARRRTAASVA